MAAEEMGSVRKMPTTTDTTMPMAKGCRSVAHITMPPSQEAAAPMAGAHSIDRPQPTTMVTKGVTRMSTFVSPATILPASQATMATTSTASGPPAPPRVFAAAPTATSENSTSAGARRAKPIDTAMAGPAAALAYPPISSSTPMPSCVPSVAKMVPMSREAKRPCAMAPIASMR